MSSPTGTPHPFGGDDALTEPECSHRCGGQCCRRFPINFTPSELRGHYANALELRRRGEENQWARDMIMMARMLIPLGPDPFLGQPMYTCKHHDVESGLCGVYESRPKMCRDYPGRDAAGGPGACHICGFTRPEGELAQIRRTRTSGDRESVWS